MKDTDPVDLFLTILLAIVCLLAGVHFGIRQIRKDAIEAGVGRWEVDAKTGDTQFTFIKP